MTTRAAFLAIPLAALLGACGGESDAPANNAVTLNDPLANDAMQGDAMMGSQADEAPLSNMTSEQVSGAMASGNWNTSDTTEAAPANAM